MTRAMAKCASIWVAVALLSATAKATEPSDEYLKVTVEGIAEGTGTSGRTGAIKAAESQALAIALTALLDERYLDLAAGLQRQPERYVQTSRLISSKGSDGETHAIVEVYLRNHELRSDIAGAVFPRMQPRPRVLILVAEELATESFLNTNAPGHTETLLANAFRSSGFVVLDSNELRQRYGPPELMAYAQGSAAAVSRFGLENQADMVLVGEAVSRIDADQSRGNLQRVEAKTTLRLVRAIDAALADSRTSTAAVHAVSALEGAQLALRDAAVKVQQPLMVSAVLAMVGTGQMQHYTLTIESPGSRAFLEAVTAHIESYPEVDGVEVLRMSATEALVQFRYSGKLRPLVESLEALDHPMYALEPTRVVGRTLVFQTVPR